MTDPAVEAARRVAAGEDQNFIRGAKAGAREALAPIRELEVPGLLDDLAEILSHLVMDAPKDQELTDRYVTMLRNAAANMRPLIYTTEELSND